MKWKIKSGEEILIEDMSTEHIVNSMKLLERYAGRKRRVAVHKMLTYPEPSIGTAAELCWEREFNTLLKSEVRDFLPDIYYELEKELKNRRIDG